MALVSSKLPLLPTTHTHRWCGLHSNFMLVLSLTTKEIIVERRFVSSTHCHLLWKMQWKCVLFIAKCTGPFLSGRYKLQNSTYLYLAVCILFCCKKWLWKELVFFCLWHQKKRWDCYCCGGHPAIKMKSCHLQKKSQGEWNLVLLALAVLLLSFSSHWTHMLAHFQRIFMPHRWDFSNIQKCCSCDALDLWIFLIIAHSHGKGFPPFASKSRESCFHNFPPFSFQNYDFSADSKVWDLFYLQHLLLSEM